MNKTCDNCWHGRGGYCKLYSSRCATAVSDRVEEPPSWLDCEEGKEELLQMVLKGRR